jgi:hypothetical protein
MYQPAMRSLVSGSGPSVVTGAACTAGEHLRLIPGQWIRRRRLPAFGFPNPYRSAITETGGAIGHDKPMVTA